MPQLQWVPDDEIRNISRYIVSNDQPKGGFRLILVTQSKGWEKAVRVYENGSEQWKEVKCGDKSGKVCKSDPSIKYSDMYIKFPGSIKLSFWRPGAVGIWDNMEDRYILQKDFETLFNGCTYYVWWSNYDEGYFQNQSNQIKADKLM